MSNHLQALLASTGLEVGNTVTMNGQDPVLPSRFRIGEAAATALGATGLSANELWTLSGGAAQEVSVDVKGAAASLISFIFQRLEKGDQPIREDRALVDLYQAGDDRWVHLHGAFPKLAEGTLRVLDCEPTVDAVAAAMRKWKAQDLEDALAAQGLCGAMARTRKEWLAHEQGKAIANIPPVEIIKIGDSDREPISKRSRPLAGMRVLDLTRVLAGPTCARTLASHGADILKINSPSLPSVPPFVIDTGHGKRSALLDLDVEEDASTLRTLASTADVFSQGYRKGALERRGFGLEELAELRPGIIYVSINAYGHVGPWAERPGWEQLAQTASGAAVDEGTFEAPRLIGAAATDYTTGYLAALGVMAAMKRRAVEGGSYHVRASLCQTASWLYSFGLFDRDAPQPEMDFGLAEPYMTRSESGFGLCITLGQFFKCRKRRRVGASPQSPLGPMKQRGWPGTSPRPHFPREGRKYLKLMRVLEYPHCSAGQLIVLAYNFFANDTHSQSIRHSPRAH